MNEDEFLAQIEHQKALDAWHNAIVKAAKNYPDALAKALVEMSRTLPENQLKYLAERTQEIHYDTPNFQRPIRVDPLAG